MSTNNIEKLVRKNISLLVPYQSARSLNKKGNIWLNANEYPESTNIIFSHKNLNRYPYCQPKELIDLYAVYAGVKNNQIIVHRGADEGIELLMKVFCNPIKDKIMFFPPTYGMYKINADILGVKYKALKTKNDWQLDLISISQNIQQVKLVYICNPNNPTGSVIDHKDFHQLMNIVNKKIIVVIDEAYIEFSPKNTLINCLSKYSNLVILRTLSKAFSLAGLRCGFTLANKKIIHLLLKIITPYPLSVPVIEIAKYFLREKNIFLMNKRIKKTIKIKNWFIKSLHQFTCIEKIFSSNTNYILIKFKSAKYIFKQLQKKGIILRDQSYQLGLKNCIRITIGTYKECKKTLCELKKIFI